MISRATRQVGCSRLPSRRRLRRGALAIALGATLLATRALAHPDHGAHDDGGSGAAALPAILLGLGGVLVVAGLALDHRGDVPRQYGHGLVLGGAAMVLVLAPLLWWF